MEVLIAYFSLGEREKTKKETEHCQTKETIQNGKVFFLWFEVQGPKRR